MVKNWQAVLSLVKSALVRRGRTEHDAEDLVQDAWVRLATSEHYPSIRKPEAFLMRTALNLLTDAYRVEQSRGEQLTIDAVELMDSSPGPEDSFFSKERMARLVACLEDLSPKTREIFLAHRVDGMKYQDIARQHGLSVSAVEKHIAKAALVVAAGMEGW